MKPFFSDSNIGGEPVLAIDAVHVVNLSHFKCVYLHLPFLCGGLTQRQLEGQDGYSRSRQSGRIPGAFTWDTPEKMRGDLT